MNPAFGFGFGRVDGRGFGRFCWTAGWRSWWPGGAYQGLEAGAEVKMLEDRIRELTLSVIIGIFVLKLAESEGNAMDKAKTNFSFKLMAFEFRLRDFFRPRMDILKEVGIKPGDRVLDYGCGPGGYIVPLAELTGPEGKIYALDIHPLAIEMVRNIAFKKRLTNVETIRSDCRNGLPDKSMDVVLLYDILHHLSNPDEVLKELHRVLKPNGLLSVSDHHLQENEIVSKVVKGGLFELSKKGKRTYNFAARTHAS